MRTEMTNDADLALIHAELDGELNSQQRGELSRRMLADPQIRASRDGLRRVCAAIEAIPEIEPPAQLHASVLNALPSASPQSTRLSQPPHKRWRYAAALAAALILGIVVFAALDGERYGSADLAGTMASPRAPAEIDGARLDNGPLTGWVRLYREGGGLGVAFDLAAKVPVDVIIASGGRTLRVNGVEQKGPAGKPTAVALARLSIDRAQTVNLTFLSSGHEIARATLRAPAER
jgi:hypothetical protein